MDLSLIIPAYNSSEFILTSINLVSDYLLNIELEYELVYEIVLVDDGSSDNTVAVAEKSGIQNLRIIKQPKNQGKYAAIKEGVKNASGRVIIFTDADIPFDLEAISYIYKLISKRNFHIVIGDRSIAESSYLQLPMARRLGTFIFSGLVRMLVTGGLFDTQCGLKGFRKDVAKEIFSLVRADGFSGDVELLYIALKYNLEIKRIPVRLRNAAPSSVNILKHGLSMTAKIIGLKKNWQLGYYNSESLKKLSSQKYWE